MFQIFYFKQESNSQICYKLDSYNSKFLRSLNAD